MKKMISFVIGLILPYILLSQSIEPTQRSFTYFSMSRNSTTTTLLNPEDADFKQDSMIIGYQWETGRRISDGLLFNQDDIDENRIGPNEVDRLVGGSDLMIRMYNSNTAPYLSISSHAGEESVMNARGFTYKPYYLIYENNINNFVPNSSDPSSPVWGFRYIRGTIGNYFLQLGGDDIDQDNPVVLSDPWPSNHLAYNSGVDNPSPYVTETYLGYSFYISIILKRDGECNLDGLDGNNVLKVEMPYWLTNPSSTFAIKFSQVPDPLAISYSSVTSTLNEPRGKVRNLISSPSSTTFAITESMLPTDGTDITINAYFYCDDKILSPDFHNPVIQSQPELTNSSETFAIHDLGIKISYLGKCPVKITDVRIMTPNCKDLLEGVWDAICSTEVDLMLDRYCSSTFSDRHIRPFRFNNVVEGHTQNWIAERYFNKLIGSLGTGEDASLYPDRYEYYVKPADRWIGYYKIPANVSVPYSRYVTDYTPVELLLQTVGTFNGYMGIRGNGSETRDLETDPAKSHYETYLTNFSEALPISYFLNHDDLPKYEQAINWGNNYGRASYQALHENMLYHSFLSSKCQGLLFSDKFWWGQIFNLCKFANATIEGVEKSYFSQHRPFTGEELRLSMWTPIILGAKGLIYDGPISNFGAFSAKNLIWG